MNPYKFLLGAIGAFSIVYFNLQSKEKLFNSILFVLSWLLVAYAVALRISYTTITDYDPIRLGIGIGAALLISIGNIIYGMHKDNYIIYLLGLVLFLLGKSGLIAALLNLTKISQFIVVLSTLCLIIGNILIVFSHKSKNPRLWYSGLLINIVGWILFVINITIHSQKQILHHSDENL